MISWVRARFDVRGAKHALIQTFHRFVDAVQGACVCWASRYCWPRAKGWRRRRFPSRFRGPSSRFRQMSMAGEGTRTPPPKKLIVLEGSAHAQYLFDTERGPGLMENILHFLSNP